jgi:hypothetical protein
MLLHVGYHKTATTWLQQRLFDNADAAFSTPWSFDEVIDRLVRPHPLAWDEAEARDFFMERGDAARAAGHVPVLSNEELSGNPHAGAFNSTIIATRLAQLFPDARVLVVIRRQADMLVSIYKQYVVRGGVLPHRRYFEPPAAGFRMPVFRAGHLEYHRLIEHYVELFGADRVRVLAMEDLTRDPATFVREITSFAGARDPGPLPSAPVRRSHAAATAAVQRRLNRWLLRDDVNPTAPFRFGRLPSLMRRVDPILARVMPGADRRLRAYAESFARGRYAESNRRTAALTGLPLAQLGYES